jgi:hypothetical protein
VSSVPFGDVAADHTPFDPEAVEVGQGLLPDSEFVAEIRTASLSRARNQVASVLLVLSLRAFYAPGFRPGQAVRLPWSVSVRRLFCHAPSRSPFATRFFLRWRQHADPHDVAAQFALSVRTVQRLFARFHQRGPDGIAPDYSACGQRQAGQAAAPLIEQICQSRREPPRWGSEMIRLELEGRADALPCARTIRRHLSKAGLQPAPAGRPAAASSRPARADRPHQG